MTQYEYKVVPAPDRGLKARGVKGPEGRFAHALEVLMNEMGVEGWEYQRAETLPCEERQGLSGKTTVYRNMLVFRRVREDDVAAFEPRLLDPPKEIPVLDAARALAAEDRAAAAKDAAWEDTGKADTPADPERDAAEVGQTPDAAEDAAGFPKS